MAEAWGLGRRVMENIQAYLFKTSAHLNATWGFVNSLPALRQPLLQNALQMGSRTSSISPLLPHFNPKQSEVMKRQQEFHLFEASLSTSWVEFTQVEQSRQWHKEFNAQFFHTTVKILWHYTVNVSSSDLSISGCETHRSKSVCGWQWSFTG